MHKTVIAKLNHLRIAPRKARLIADLIRGLPFEEAEARLILSPKRASEPFLKLLRSARANAVHNFRIEAEKLYVRSVRVDGGPMLKRWMPRAMGATSPIQKKTSHLTLELGLYDAPRIPKFEIRKKQKKDTKKEVKTKKKKEKEERPEMISSAPKPKQKPGFLKRVFRRKSI